MVWRGIRSGQGLLNISGLLLGFVFFILIRTWIAFQQGYDTFHHKGDRIFRVVKYVTDSRSGRTPIAVTPGPLAGELAEQASVAASLRITDVEFCVRTGENCLYKKGIAVDSSFWHIFDFHLLDRLDQSVQGPDQIILTERLARIFFGSASVLGKTCVIGPRTLLVTGMMANPPANNHLGDFDFVLPMEFMRVNKLRDPDNWKQSNLYTYIELRSEDRVHEVEKAVADILENHDQKGSTLALQPLRDIHLRSGHLSYDLPGRGNEQYVDTFSWVGSFVLLIACLTYANLSTAQYLKNLREAGIRQFLGATYGQMALQWLGQAFIYNTLALTIAGVAAWFLLPHMEDLTGSPLRQTLVVEQLLVPVMVAFVLAVLVSALIPIMLQARHKAAEGLRGWVFQPGAIAQTRRILVIAQFSLAIGLITAMWIVREQLGFIQRKDLGYEKEAIVSFTAVRALSDRFDGLKAELLSLPAVRAVCRHQHPITNIQQSTDDVTWQGKAVGESVLFHKMSVDFDFVPTYKLELVSGRSFSEHSPADSNAILLNQKAAAIMDIDQAEEQFITVNKRSYRVIGILKDFHITSVHAPIGPLVVFTQPSILGNVSVAVQPGTQQQSLRAIETIFKKYAPGRPFDYHFVDEDLTQMYATEDKVLRIFGYTGAVSVALACLGLLAISLLQVQQKTREIAIRKVNGASLFAIARLLVREYFTLLLIAMVLASFGVGYFMYGWLQQFAYRVDVPPSAFLYSYMVVWAAAFLSVTVSLLKALRTNPAYALRHM